MTTELSTEKQHQVLEDFKKAVNMTAAEIEHWLDTPESKAVGQTHTGETESVGHQSGQKIIRLLKTSDAKLSEDDFTHMRKVVSYVHRHLAQHPQKEAIEDSHWRYSLMNWGHDPLK